MIRHVAFVCAFAIFVSVVAAMPAGATTAGDFVVTLDRPPYVTSNAGSADYKFADITTSTTMRIRRGSTEIARGSSSAGNTRVSVVSAAMEPGDIVEIYKPQLPAGPPSVGPVDQYAIPAIGVAGVAGGMSVNGAAPSGALARVLVGVGCERAGETSLPVIAVGGTFSTATSPLAAGADLQLRIFSGVGDYTELRTAVPGETPCFSAYAYPYPEQPTLDPEAATPYGVRVANLQESVAPNSRLVWRRGAAILGDTTGLGGSSIYLKSATQPVPGDVLEVYRPQTAATPSRTVTIPAASAVIDTAASLVAIDANLPASYVEVFAGDTSPSSHTSRRVLMALAAGRTLVDFNVPQADQRAFPMHPGGRAVISWYSADSAINYSFNAAPGDLVPPQVQAKFKSKLRLSKIKKTISVRLNSTESATGAASLLVAKNLPRKGAPKAKPGKRTFKFASAKLALTPGSRTVKLKLSKAGLKALKRLRGAGKSMRPVAATLTLTLTDASGNTSTTTRAMKLVAK
ncbi:MAG: hypothetical protein HYX29_01805 [Solirubrobacterales bacterium]|nr:hypothetical protein [Solirubrobacterales bacterium]